MLLQNREKHVFMLYIRPVTKMELPELLRLQKRCYVSEAAIYNDYAIQPLRQTLEELCTELEQGSVCLVAWQEQTIIGSVRGYVKDATGYIHKLIVAPEYQNQGIGKQLMYQMETALAPVTRYELFTGSKSVKNLLLYQKLGYRAFREQPVNDQLTLVFLYKQSDPDI